ncbi:MAG TPA: hypothetical protein VFH06_02845 [Candidatus Saccharimonadales bacterium]|nr:hypothetical protein [Candidatus Saccharimonadales bacterium]
MVQKNKKAKALGEKSAAKESRKNWAKQWLVMLRGKLENLKLRRPHRSFKRTYKRDYARSLKIPGYWAFTNEVRATLWKHKKTFSWLVVVYGALTAAIIGIASQTAYEDYSNTLKESGDQLFQGNWWEAGRAGILLASGVLGSLNNAPNDVEKFVAVLLGLMVWLTTIWLLRAMIAGKKPKFRDGLYNSSAPLVSTALVFAVGVIQLLPVALAAIAFAAGSSSGLINDGIEAMIFWLFEILLLALSLYWITSTLFALVLVTLPGMYPMRAIETAGDLVIGRRLRILLRFIWLFALTIVVWAIIIIPIIFFDAWIKSVWPAIQWFPLVPICLLILASISIVWLSSYTYLLYRKVVDDDASPA